MLCSEVWAFVLNLQKGQALAGSCILTKFNGLGTLSTGQPLLFPHRQ